MTSEFLAELEEWFRRAAEAIAAVFRALAERLAVLVEQAQRLLDLLAEPAGPQFRIEAWPRWRMPVRVDPGRGLSSTALGRAPWRPVRF